jgi:RHS repeat-associated protein
MAGGDQAAMVRALADDAGQAAGDAAGAMAKLGEDTASIADRNLESTLSKDADFGQKFSDIKPGSEPVPTTGVGGGDPVPGGGTTPTASGPVDPPPLKDGNPGTQSVPASDRPSCNDPVDPSTGEMFMQQTDLRLDGVLPLLFERVHISGYAHGRLFGRTWAGTLDQRVEVDDDGIHNAAPDGVVLHYPVPARPGLPVLPSEGARWPLDWDRTGDRILIHQPERGLVLEFPPGPVPERFRPLAAVVDRNRNRITIACDAEGVPTDVYHSGGYRVRVDSTETRGGTRVRSLALADPAGGPDTPVVTFDYDPAGRLTETTDFTGLPFGCEYDRDDRITAWTDRTGYRHEYRYGPDGRIVYVGGEDGYLAAHFAYDDAAGTTTVTDSLGHDTVYHRDGRGRVTVRVDPLGGTVLAERDRYGRVVSSTDQLGAVTRFSRDENGDAVRVEHPNGSSSRTEYNALRLPTAFTNPNGAVWRYAYDERGNLVEVTDPDGAATGYAYDERGALIRVTDALSQVTAIQCDGAGLPVSIVDPAGGVWAAARDARGRIVTQTDPLGAVTASVWDGRDNLLSRKYPDGTSDRWERDANGNPVAQTNPAGHTTRFETGPFSLVTARIDPDGTRHTFDYDTELRVVSVSNPQQSVWTYRYDGGGNLVGETDFNGRTLSYAHDAAGRLTRRVNGVGQTLELVRDALGQVVEQRMSDGGGNDGGGDSDDDSGGSRSRAEVANATFEYDPAGNLIRARGGDCDLSLTRDALGRVVTQSTDGATVSSSFDAVGRRLTRTTAAGHVSVWAYDPAGRPASLTSGAHQLTFGHDAAGRETYRWLGQDVAVTSEWDALGRLSARRLLGVDGPAEARTSTLLSERSWTYRQDGAPDSSTDTADGVRRFELDPFGRVTAVQATTWTESYAYDTAGNLTHAADTRSPDAPAAGTRETTGTLLRRAGRTSYEYDAQGRLTGVLRRTLSGQRQTWTYTYDAQDRMIQAVVPGGETWRYRYDPLGRRIGKQRLGPDGAPLAETRFVWDGAVLAEEQHDELSTATVTVTGWDHEPGSWTPVVQRRRIFHRDTPQAAIDEQFHAIVTDLVGTPEELVARDGTVAWRRRAGLWGEPIASTDGGGRAAEGAVVPSIDCPLRFPGQYHDAETRLDYNYQRYYDPAAGRYTVPDPLGLSPAPNHHAYVDNPLAWIDPLGLDSTGGGDGLEWVDPSKINFSQRSVAGNDYAGQMRAGTWDWTRPGTALRVMEVNGQLVTYDNRRLDAAFEAGETKVPITRVDPAAPDGISTAGRTWQQAFTKRLNDPRNVRAGGRVPPEGTSERPTVCP